MPTEDMGPITQRTTFSMQSLAIDVELLLGDRPKYECMEECRRAIRQIKQQAQMKIQEVDQEIQNIVIPEGGMDVEAWEKCMVKILAALTS